MMEADSTTLEKETSVSQRDPPKFPFVVLPSNLKFYIDHIHEHGKGQERELVKWLQEFGLLPSRMKCPRGQPQCNMICKPARVVDRVQWSCELCGVRLPIRSGTIFLNIPCSLYQIMQLVLAWCEDADYKIAAEHFEIKTHVAYSLFEKIDNFAIEEILKSKFGGEDSVVLCEMYPDCMNRLSPDTTDQRHSHRILMITDSNHIPARYWLHVITSDVKNGASDKLPDEVDAVLEQMCAARSLFVRSEHVPWNAGRHACTVNTLAQRCENSMQHFVLERVWRQAVTLCSSARDICSNSVILSATQCAVAVQRYLNVSLYRIRQGDNSFEQMLRLISESIPKD